MRRSFKSEGIQPYKVDAKGRVSVPASFRRVLEEADPEWSPGANPTVYLVGGARSQPYIEGIPALAMDEIERRIAAKPLGSRERTILEYVYSATTQRVQLDDTGRLVLPRWMREKAGIGGQAMFVALGDRFQIWDPERWAGRREAIETLIEQLPAELPVAALLDMPAGTLDDLVSAGPSGAGRGREER
ncbi:MAG: cell division/cell wall cluster transcriptional repressor MraZ [Alphaproteobacteria bacterium]|nr:MAG: cell division/cell wall cluster transcriptional repressor MraZ [Alphaproteobacteria bacterium]